MPAFLALQPYGLLVLDERGEVLASAGLPRDPDAVARVLSDEKLLDEALEKVLARLKGDEVFVNDELLKGLLDRRGIGSVLSPNEPPFLEIRKAPHRYASRVWGELGRRDYFLILNEIGVEVTKGRIKEQLSSLDQQVIRAIDYIDHVNTVSYTHLTLPTTERV